MKITGTDPGTSIQALAAAQQARATDSDPAPEANAGLASKAGLNEPGTVQLSQRAQEVSQAQEAARAVPEVRPEVVEQAKIDLAAGQMKADPSELAALIARDLF